MSNDEHQSGFDPQAWAMAPNRPITDFYELVGVPLFCDDLDRIAKAIRSASRAIHSYQNHSDTAVSDRAAEILFQLGKAEATFADPVKLNKQHSQVLTRLHAEWEQQCETPATVEEWLAQQNVAQSWIRIVADALTSRELQPCLDALNSCTQQNAADGESEHMQTGEDSAELSSQRTEANIPRDPTRAKKKALIVASVVAVGILIVASVLTRDDPSSEPATGSSSSEVASQQKEAGDLLELAKVKLEENNLQQARDLAAEALSASSSDSQREELQTVIDEATARQRFLNRRVAELSQQSQAALTEGDFNEARQLANRALKIEMATNHHLAKAAISRLDGFEQGVAATDSEGNAATPANSSSFSWADVVTKVKPGVVVIASEFENGVSTGTGFVVGEDLVVTNHHVISDSRSGGLASRVLVKCIDGQSSLSPGVLHRNASKDIAIIKLGHHWDAGKSLHIFRGDIRQGEEVAALGHPKGYEFSFTMGHVSAVRDAGSFAQQLDGLWVQHSAPISKGNSGGPLLNKRAEVIAMNSWYHDEGKDQNLNFAISATEIDDAIRISGYKKILPFNDATSSASERALRAALRNLIAQ